MTEDKIKKLIELAHRGVGGEMQNAKDILKKHGVDWSKPRLNFAQKVKEKFAGRYKIEYTIPLQYASDTQLIMVLCEIYAKNGDEYSIHITGNGNAKLTAYPEVISKVVNVYNKIRKDYDRAMQDIALNILK